MVISAIRLNELNIEFVGSIPIKISRMCLGGVGTFL